MQTSTAVRQQTETQPKAPVFPRGQMLAFAFVTILFFIWGMSNNLTDILVQQFRKGFELSQLQAQLVQTANFFGYFFVAIPAAKFMRRFGYKAGILLGLSLFALGTLLFWPAAIIGRYTPFLVALFITGAGAATLETAGNPLIAEFGPAETSERRLNFVQSLNPPGTIVGVLIGTFFIFSGVEHSSAKTAEMKAAGTYAAYVHGEIMRVVPTYVALGMVVILCAVLIARTRFPDFATRPSAADDDSRFVDLFRFPHLWFAVLVQFCYVGAQVSTWSGFIPYLKQYTGVSERGAGLLLIGNLIALGVGRVMSTALMRWMSPVKMMGVYAIINVGLLGIGIVHPGLVGAYAILLTSFFMSIMFPTIFALGVKGLGRHTKLGGSVIVMSIVGGAILPPLLGLVARQTGRLALGYLVVAAAYLVVAAYGLLNPHAFPGEAPPNVAT